MAVKTVEVLAKQTIWDIAIQEYGSVESAFQIMKDNPEVTLSTNLFAGQLLKIKGLPTNKVIASYFKTNDLHPVSMINGSSCVGDFNNDFNHDFKK